MQLAYFHVGNDVPQEIMPDAAVVIDVLRATTTIARALHNGAEAVQTFADLDKLINTQKLSYKVNISKIPISKNLKKIILSKKLKKINKLYRGDDYQILFTASKKKSRIIKRTFKSLGIKISKIGNISSGTKKSQIIDEKGNKIAIKNKGYVHNF